MVLVRLGALLAFIVSYAAMYAAFGVASPFWPRFFESRGLTAGQLGLLFGLGTLARWRRGLWSDGSPAYWVCCAQRLQPARLARPRSRC